MIKFFNSQENNVIFNFLVQLYIQGPWHDEFPEVTICPPARTDTSINYDMMAAKDISEEDEEIFRTAMSVFIKNNYSYSHYYDAIQTNNRHWKVDQIKAMYNGTMELPVPNQPMKNGSFYKYQADNLNGFVTIYTTYSPNDVNYADVNKNTENNYFED